MALVRYDKWESPDGESITERNGGLIIVTMAVLLIGGCLVQGT
ncbi:MAG: hypothetical protein U0992_14905 [Planctomycetaceae bacterium]